MANIPVKSNGNNDWVEYRRVVLDKLDNLETDVSTLATEQVNIRLDIRELRIRAALWGGAAGGVLSLIGVTLSFLL